MFRTASDPIRKNNKISEVDWEKAKSETDQNKKENEDDQTAKRRVGSKGWRKLRYN